MKMNYKKSLKLITLLITSLLIATASAATYKYMYLNGTVNIGSRQIVWIQDGIELSDSTVSKTLNVEPGVPQAINDTLYLKNKDGNPHNMTITVTTAANASKFDLFKIYIYTNESGSWTFVDILNPTQPNDQYSSYTEYHALYAGKSYKLDFAITAKAGESGSTTFKLEVKYE